MLLAQLIQPLNTQSYQAFEPFEIAENVECISDWLDTIDESNIDVNELHIHDQTRGLEIYGPIYQLLTREGQEIGITIIGIKV